MNSYFEQSTGGFYGGHHHQSSAAAQHHDPASAAAYRSFPLGLGMSPYASTQHHHHHLAAAAAAANSGSTRPPQDSPYDASVASACKLYSQGQSGAGESGGSGYGASAGSGSVSGKDCKQQEQAVAAAVAAHQNGYAAVMAAAAVKDVWQSGGASAGGQPGSGSGAGAGVVRPSACTPDGSRLGSATGYSGLVGSAPDAASSPGNNGSSRSLGSAGWNTCSLNSSAASQPVANQLHQQSPASHTFYPWMAIAGWLAKKSSRGQSPVAFAFPDIVVVSESPPRPTATGAAVATAAAVLVLVEVLQAMLQLTIDGLCSRSERAAQTGPSDVHALPDARAGEGVSHKPLPDQAEAHRNGARSLPDGAADKDMVPESADEAEKGDSGDQGAERAGKAGPGAEGRGGGGSGSRGASTAGRPRRAQLGVRPAPQPQQSSTGSQLAPPCSASSPVHPALLRGEWPPAPAVYVMPNR